MKRILACLVFLLSLSLSVSGQRTGTLPPKQISSKLRPYKKTKAEQDKLRINRHRILNRKQRINRIKKENIQSDTLRNK